jgi:HSP20 family protein
MRVTDLIPWRAARGNQPASRDRQNPVALLQNDVNRAFDDFLRMLPMPLPGWSTAIRDDDMDFQVDIVETDKEVKVSAEMPGIDEADIDVSVSDGMLTISADKKADRETKEGGHLLLERSFGHVERTLPLTDNIDANAAQASFKRGVLTVTIPKTSKARSDAKRIPVQST